MEDRMGDGKGLAKLRAVDNSAIVDLLGNNGVGVDVELAQIEAGQKQAGLPIGSNIQLGSGACIQPADIAHGNGGIAAFTMMDDGLKSSEDLAGFRVLPVAEIGEHHGLGLEDQLEAARQREFEIRLIAGAICELRGSLGSQDTCFELQVARGSQCGRRGNGGPARIGIYLLLVFQRFFAA